MMCDLRDAKRKKEDRGEPPGEVGPAQARLAPIPGLPLQRKGIESILPLRLLFRCSQLGRLPFRPQCWHGDHFDGAGGT